MEMHLYKRAALDTIVSTIIILSINNVPDDETNSTRRIPENICVSLSIRLSSIERRNHLFLVSLALEVRKRKDRKNWIVWITNGNEWIV